LIKSGIENPSKSGVIGRCGGDGKTEWPCGTDKSRTLKKQTFICSVYETHGQENKLYSTVSLPLV